MKLVQARAVACSGLLALLAVLSVAVPGAATAAPGGPCNNEGNGGIGDVLAGNDDLTVVDAAPLFVGADLGFDNAGVPDPNTSTAVCVVVYDPNSRTDVIAEVDRGDLPDNVSILPTRIELGDGDTRALVDASISGAPVGNGHYPLVPVPDCVAVLASC